MKTFYWDVGELPFVYKHLTTPNNKAGIPNKLPFRLFIDNITGALQQDVHSDVLLNLKRVYEEGSIISGNMNSSGIGKDYATDFLDFILKQLGRKNLTGLKVLEVGCGNGYFLSLLKNLGADAIGIEPGPQGQDGAAEFNVKIIRDFFPAPQLMNQSFDVVIGYCILEHINKPTVFLNELRKLVNGNLFISVEDEEPYIENGDISILFHEHISYFTRDTLTRTLDLSRFKTKVIKESPIAKILYARAETNSLNIELNKDISEYRKQACVFRKRSNVSSKKLIEEVQKSDSFGVYVPGRAINVLSAIDLTNVRFFDDNPILKGTYHPGINISIEDFESLKNKPVSKLYIASSSFEQKIWEKVRSIIPKNNIILWSDIFGKKKYDL